MPHVIVKMYAGRSEREKTALAEAITRAVTSTLGYGDESVSVGIEDVAPSKWLDAVFMPDIVEREATLFKKPGYDPRRK